MEDFTNRLRGGALISYLGKEAQDADVKEFFVETVLESLKLLKKYFLIQGFSNVLSENEVDMLISAIEGFLSDYELTVSDSKKLRATCTSIILDYLRMIEETKTSKGKQQQAATKSKKKTQKKQNKDQSNVRQDSELEEVVRIESDNNRGKEVKKKPKNKNSEIINSGVFDALKLEEEMRERNQVSVDIEPSQEVEPNKQKKNKKDKKKQVKDANVPGNNEEGEEQKLEANLSSNTEIQSPASDLTEPQNNTNELAASKSDFELLSKDQESKEESDGEESVKKEKQNLNGDREGEHQKSQAMDVQQEIIEKAKEDVSNVEDNIQTKVIEKQVIQGLDEEKKGSDSMSNDIKVEKFDISYQSKILFKDATLTLAHGRKYGLVAPNGTGKSTLLKYIANREDKFVDIPRHFLILYVEQEVIGDETLALESVIAADTERAKLLFEEKRLMDDENFDEESSQRLAFIHSRLDQIEAYSAEARASSILTGLQFTEEMKLRATKDFSGGWRMRIALARALFCRPTLLLLDEPTNHLDLLAVIWLETYLKKWKSTLLVVSHDQDFLNNVCTDIIHIYQQKLEYYKGNYDNFKKAFTDLVSQKRKAYEKQKKLIQQAQREKAKKDTQKAMDKAKRDVKVLRNKSLSQKKKQNKDEEVESKPELEEIPRDYTVHFDFPDPEKLSIPIIQVNDASFTYSNDKPPLFKDLNFGIDLQSRIALVGPNGAGKSTLLKLLDGKLTPTQGTINRNRKLVIGRFSQHFVDQLSMDQNPIEYLQSHFKEYSGQELRGMLGRFGLTGKTHLQSISSLSGGQKSRVVLAEICMRHPHILFLDGTYVCFLLNSSEPTNHLDIESIDALALALNNYQGGIILVSHDSRLISEVCHQICVVGDNTVTEYDGDFEDYRAELVQEFEQKQQEEEEERKFREDERKLKREEQLKQKHSKLLTLKS